MEDTKILSISPKSEELVDRLVDKALSRISYNLFFVDRKRIIFVWPMFMS